MEARESDMWNRGRGPSLLVGVTRGCAVRARTFLSPPPLPLDELVPLPSNPGRSLLLLFLPFLALLSCFSCFFFFSSSTCHIGISNTSRRAVSHHVVPRRVVGTHAP